MKKLLLAGLLSVIVFALVLAGCVPPQEEGAETAGALAGEAVAKGGATKVYSCSTLAFEKEIAIKKTKTSAKETIANSCSSDAKKIVKYACQGKTEYISKTVSCGKNQLCNKGKCEAVKTNKKTLSVTSATKSVATPKNGVYSCRALASGGIAIKESRASDKEINKENTCSSDAKKATKYSCAGVDKKGYKSEVVVCSDNQQCLQGRCVDKPYCKYENLNGKVLWEATVWTTLVDQTKKDANYKGIFFSTSGNSLPQRQQNSCKLASGATWFDQLEIATCDPARPGFAGNPHLFECMKDIQVVSIYDRPANVNLGCNQKDLRCCLAIGNKWTACTEDKRGVRQAIETDCGTTVYSPKTYDCDTNTRCEPGAGYVAGAPGLDDTRHSTCVTCNYWECAGNGKTFNIRPGEACGSYCQDGRGPVGTGGLDDSCDDYDTSPAVPHQYHSC